MLCWLRIFSNLRFDENPRVLGKEAKSKISILSGLERWIVVPEVAGSKSRLLPETIKRPRRMAGSYHLGQARAARC